MLRPISASLLHSAPSISACLINIMTVSVPSIPESLYLPFTHLSCHIKSASVSLPFRASPYRSLFTSSHAFERRGFSSGRCKGLLCAAERRSTAPPPLSRFFVPHEGVLGCCRDRVGSGGGGGDGGDGRVIHQPVPHLFYQVDNLNQSFFIYI